MTKTKKKILLVDDDQLVHTILGEYLRQEGFAVCSAFGWRDTVAKLAHFTPDLFILDVMMPEIDGIMIAETLKNEVGYEAPVMIYSALREPDGIMKGLAAVSSAFVSKPSPLPEILATVHRLLAERPAAGPETTETP